MPRDGVTPQLREQCSLFVSKGRRKTRVWMLCAFLGVLENIRNKFVFT